MLCKTMERVLASHLTSTVATMLEPLQFAYKSDRGTDGFVLNMVTNCLVHPQIKQVFYLWILAQILIPWRHILLKSVIDLNINSWLILWTRDFICCPQRECARCVHCEHRLPLRLCTFPCAILFLPMKL